MTTTPTDSTTPSIPVPKGTNAGLASERGPEHQTIVDRDNRFAIVGAGFCGLGIGNAFRRHGIEFDLLEARDALGGNWYGGVYDSVHIISSRKTTEFPEFPMPTHWPDFPSGRQMLSYLRSYAEHCQLHEYIELSTRVIHAEPEAPGQPDERWVLTVRTGDTVERRRYRGLIVAIGHHWDRRMPEYPGAFAGQLMHSKDYHSPESLRGKRVLVVGGGNSACDIAVEASRVAASAHISMRRGYWFMPKTVFGKPLVELSNAWTPIWLQRLFIKAIVAVVFGDYRNYGLQVPDHEPYEHHPTVNSQLLYALRHGRITPHPDIARFAGPEVEFADGTRAPIDVVICATGYHQSFPFLPPDTVPVVDNVPQLIGDLMRPDLRNLYVFGVSQARYGVGPLISDGAETLAVLIEAQRDLRKPLGSLLSRLGQKPANTVLRDPHEMLRRARMGRLLVRGLGRFLPRLERLIG